MRYIGAENLKRYDRFVLLNCGIGGPFLPEEAMTSRIHWSRFFTSRVTEKVKLVGITVSNQAATPAFVGQRYNHVQSMLWATDLSGLQVGRVFPSWRFGGLRMCIGCMGFRVSAFGFLGSSLRNNNHREPETQKRVEEPSLRQT